MDFENAVTRYLADYDNKRKALVAGLEKVLQKKAVRRQTLMEQDDLGNEILAKKKNLEQQWDARSHELLMTDHKGAEILARQEKLESELSAMNGNGMHDISQMLAGRANTATENSIQRSEQTSEANARAVISLDGHRGELMQTRSQRPQPGIGAKSSADVTQDHRATALPAPPQFVTVSKGTTPIVPVTEFGRSAIQPGTLEISQEQFKSIVKTYSTAVLINGVVYITACGVTLSNDRVCGANAPEGTVQTVKDRDGSDFLNSNGGLIAHINQHKSKVDLIHNLKHYVHQYPVSYEDALRMSHGLDPKKPVIIQNGHFSMPYSEFKKPDARTTQTWQPSVATPAEPSNLEDSALSTSLGTSNRAKTLPLSIEEDGSDEDEWEPLSKRRRF